MTNIGRMSNQDLDRLPSMDSEEAALTLREALGWRRGRCVDCNDPKVVRPREGTSFAGTCSCGGAVELLDHS